MAAAGGGAGQGMPPSKQQQHEEALAPLDDQERRAVQKRLQRRAAHGGGQSHTSRAGTSSARYQDPAFMGSARSGRSARGRYTSRSAMTTSRSMMTTARSSSPTGRYHPDPTRRLEIRKVRHASCYVPCRSSRAVPLVARRARGPACWPATTLEAISCHPCSPSATHAHLRWLAAVRIRAWRRARRRALASAPAAASAVHLRPPTATRCCPPTATRYRPLPPPPYAPPLLARSPPACHKPRTHGPLSRTVGARAGGHARQH